MAGFAHLGVGFASKPTVSKIPTVVLLIASLLLDILALVFYVFKLEKTPNAVLSHSLVMAVVWSMVFGLIMLLIYRSWRFSIGIGLLVLSHWVIDFITCPMNAIFPNSTGIPVFMDWSCIVGLGLYKSLPGVIICEAGVLIAGIVFYIKYKSVKKGRSLTGSK